MFRFEPHNLEVPSFLLSPEEPGAPGPRSLVAARTRIMKVKRFSAVGVEASLLLAGAGLRPPRLQSLAAAREAQVCFGGR